MPEVLAADDAPERGRGVVDRDRWSGFHKILGLLTAVLTLATAVTGLVAANAISERDDLEAAVQDSDAERQAAVRDGQDLAGELDAANVRIDELEAELAGRTPSPGTDDVSRESGATPVPIAGYYGIDLDSTATDWGVSDNGGDEQDLRSITQAYPGTSLVAGRRSKISLADQAPTRDDCDAHTVLQDALTPEQTRQGTQMCVQTSEGRFAYVTIAAPDQAGGTITLDTTVWS